MFRFGKFSIFERRLGALKKVLLVAWLLLHVEYFDKHLVAAQPKRSSKSALCTFLQDFDAKMTKKLGENELIPNAGSMKTSHLFFVLVLFLKFLKIIQLCNHFLLAFFGARPTYFCRQACGNKSKMC